MNHTLDYLIGVSLAGKYRLDERLGQEGAAAYFLTVCGPLRERAVLKLIPEDPATSARQLEWWRRTASVSHPNVLRVLDSGRVGAPARPTDGSFLYAVFEYPDDTLESALARGPVSADEQRAIYEAVSDALRHLHALGLAHGAVDAGHIVAVGETVKLASDTIREPGPGASTAADLRALEKLFGDRRQTVEPAAAPPAEPPPPPAAAAPPPIPPVPETERNPGPRMPRWTYAGLAAPVLALLMVVAYKPAPNRADATAPPEPARQMVAASPARPATVAQPAARAVPAPRGNWRVIAYTYAGLGAAEHAARRINQKVPSLHAEVYSPRGGKSGPYLVSLGGRMTRAEAQRLQRTARAHGLPRDTFIRNYTD